MNLIEVYIGEVTRRLPESNREDIALELRSTIGDMLPDNPSEEEVKSALNELGSPVQMANGFRDWPMHLIGPQYFELYMKIIKMVLPISLVITFIAFMTINVIDYNGTGSLGDVFFNLIGDAIGGLWNTAIQTLFWITLIFVILERTDININRALKGWSADELEKVTSVPKKKKVSKSELFADLLFAAVWATLYFNADNLLGIIRNGKMDVPFFNNDVLLSYWPLVSLTLLTAVLLALYKMVVGYWTKRLAVANAVHQIFATAVIVLMLLNDQLIHPDFTNLLSLSETYQNMILAAIGLFFILSAGMDIVKGFWKAKL
ncbi:HAAS signaling domain-containing protein [Guptibacillus hwajinpoensis]|uniref:HAAS signaling domain-containing protein n=1 Tax=Guptibacillus hwajinpoensis TaxID=208199 RepID=UPI0038505771